MIPIVDAHQHLWNLERFRLPWIAPGSALDRSFLLSDYMEATRGLNVVKSVYMEVDVAEDQQVEEAERVTELCRRGEGPMAGAVISGRPAREDFAAYLDRFRDNPWIKGVRQVLHTPATPPGYCLQDSFRAGVRRLGERGLRFDLCIRPAELPDVIRLVDACPGTPFILDHCGNPDVQAGDHSQWRADLAEIARRPNVVCKVSGIVASARPGQWTADDLAPIVLWTLECFGPDRVLFGGDWPVCTLAATYAQWVQALRAIVADRNPEEQRKLFHYNAIRVYDLK